MAPLVHTKWREIRLQGHTLQLRYKLWAMISSQSQYWEFYIQVSEIIFCTSSFYRLFFPPLVKKPFQFPLYFICMTMAQK